MVAFLAQLSASGKFYLVDEVAVRVLRDPAAVWEILVATNIILLHPTN
jgi:hypothetical protein